MLSHLSIKNFATIEDVDIDFHDGLTIITGETGAGKSIVIEAISLALGSRADTTFIRSGSDKATVQLVCQSKGAEYVITRELSASGKNLCKINGEIVTLAHLGMLCKKLADIHGQYDHQSLLDPDYHVRLIDLYNKEEILPAKETVSFLFNLYREKKAQYNKLLNNEKEDQRHRDFMTFEINEIEKACLVPGEDVALAEKISFLQNSEKIYEALAGVYELMSGNDYPAIDSLNRSVSALEPVSSYSEDLKDIHSALADSYYKLDDISGRIRDMRDNMEFSPGELDNSLQRQDLIDNMKKKYGDSIEEIIEYKDSLKEKLYHIENADTIRGNLATELSEIEGDLEKESLGLSEIRKRSANELSEKIQIELNGLNFNDSKLKAEFEKNDTYSSEGFDKVQFLISTNKGEALKPLAKIASGGEMSRIMLAFKRITGDYDGIPTMIFDEIDNGISGITASIVGKKVLDISRNHQIICITHLPQIAAYGDHNYRITKSSDENMTYTSVEHLSTREKITEIARLLGGINITDTTLSNARELIDQAKNKK